MLTAAIIRRLVPLLAAALLTTACAVQTAGGHGIAARVQFVATHHHPRHAQRKDAHTSHDQGLPSVQFKTVHGSTCLRSICE